MLTPDQTQPLAIVTGASSGMGRCIATELAGRGWRTLLISRRTALLEQLAVDLRGRAPSEAFPFDLADTAGIAPAIGGFLAARSLKPAALFNVAGFGLYVPFLSQSLEEQERLMRVNHFAAVEMIRVVLPGMLERRRGHIVSLASMSTKVGPWGHAGYAASKCALASLTETLAAEHPARQSGVHFSIVNPGIVSTAYFESDSFKALWPRVEKRAIAPELVARRSVGLLERPRLEICVPRHYRFIEFIRAINPGLAHRIVTAESRPAPGRG